MCSCAWRRRARAPLASSLVTPESGGCRRSHGLKASPLSYLLQAAHREGGQQAATDVNEKKCEGYQMSRDRCSMAKQLEEQEQLTVFPICSMFNVNASTEHRERSACWVSVQSTK